MHQAELLSEALESYGQNDPRALLIDHRDAAPHSVDSLAASVHQHIVNKLNPDRVLQDTRRLILHSRA